jgi:hypothetical protein
VVDGDTHRRIDSRFCTSLDYAHRLLTRWWADHAIAIEDAHDDSDIDLDILFAHMDVDLAGAAESKVAGSIT